MGQTLIQAGLYIHIPFCRAKCPYCDFYSVPYRLDQVTSYLEALKNEATLWSPYLKDYRFVTFYVGGGTPSLLSPGFYEILLDHLYGILSFEPYELTLEANPEGLSLDKLKEFRRLGFNRLSIGAQSFLDKGLRVLGRAHTVDDIKKAVVLARKAGFENLSLDIIFAWPGQRLKDLEKEISLAVSLNPEHISCYELTIEKNTVFGKLYQEGRLTILDEDTILEMYHLIEDYLSNNGYEHYEISNYAKPGWRCQHNLFYWEAKHYLGLGASAASYIGNVRYKNIGSLKTYIEALKARHLPAREEERLSKEARFREAVILGLRILQGISQKRLYKRFGIDIKGYYGKILENLIDRGLLEYVGDFLRLTKDGMLLANQVSSYLV